MERHKEVERRLRDALVDLAMLAGDVAGNGAAWQDIAGTASVNLRSLANLLDDIRVGATHHQGCPLTGAVTFPSPAEVVDWIDANA